MNTDTEFVLTRCFTPAPSSVHRAGRHSGHCQRRTGVIPITRWPTQWPTTVTHLRGYSDHTQGLLSFFFLFLFLLSWTWESGLQFWIHMACVKPILLFEHITASSILLVVETLVKDQWQTEILSELLEWRFHGDRLQRPRLWQFSHYSKASCHSLDEKGWAGWPVFQCYSSWGPVCCVCKMRSQKASCVPGSLILL